MTKPIKGIHGRFKSDCCGIYHYTVTPPCDVSHAAEEAIQLRPRRAAAWFWFNGTPAPICRKDTANELMERWSDWRDRYQSDKRELLVCLQNMTNQEQKPPPLRIGEGYFFKKAAVLDRRFINIIVLLMKIAIQKVNWNRANPIKIDLTK